MSDNPVHRNISDSVMEQVLWYQIAHFGRGSGRKFAVVGLSDVGGGFAGDGLLAFGERGKLFGGFVMPENNTIRAVFSAIMFNNAAAYVLDRSPVRTISCPLLSARIMLDSFFQSVRKDWMRKASPDPYTVTPTLLLMVLFRVVRVFRG